MDQGLDRGVEQGFTGDVQKSEAANKDAMSSTGMKQMFLSHAANNCQQRLGCVHVKKSCREVLCLHHMS